MTAQIIQKKITRSVSLALFLGALCLLFVSLAHSAEENSSLTEAYRLSKSQEWDLAIPEYQKALKSDPDNRLIWANLGVAFSQIKKHKEALLAYEKALQLGYDNDMFRYNRGLSFMQLNLLEEAEEDFKNALKQNPRMTRAEFNLGLIYQKQGSNDLALKQVEKIYWKNTKLAEQLFDRIPPPYKVAAVDHGGSLTGVVSMSGGQPRPRYFHLIHAPNIEFCARMSDGMGHRILYDFKVSDSGGFKDVVVALVDIKKGKPFSPDDKVKSFKVNLCHSDQYVMGMNNGVDVLIENFDPIRHEIATYEIQTPKVKQKSNKPVLAKMSQLRSGFVHPDTKEFLIKCNLHPFLQTRALMVNNPYFAVTDEKGNFKIDNIPPGTYQVMAWHPFIDSQWGTVTIEPEGNSSINFEFKSEDEGRHLYHDDLNGYRFQTWYDSFKKFYGGPRQDDPVEVLQTYTPPEQSPDS